MTLPQFCKWIYKTLLKQGWTLPEIDGMDILYFFELMSDPDEEPGMSQPRRRFIDEIEGG